MPLAPQHHQPLSLCHLYLKLDVQLNADASSFHLAHRPFGDRYLRGLKIDPPVEHVLVLLLGELEVISQSSQGVEAIAQRDRKGTEIFHRPIADSQHGKDEVELFNGHWRFVVLVEHERGDDDSDGEQ